MYGGNPHESDSSKMFRLLGISLDYLRCQAWIGNLEYAHGHRCDSILDVFCLDQWEFERGYQSVMDWITSNTKCDI